MVSLEDYAGREQAYVKHVFLERYLEALVLQDGQRLQPHRLCRRLCRAMAERE